MNLGESGGLIELTTARKADTNLFELTDPGFLTENASLLASAHVGIRATWRAGWWPGMVQSDNLFHNDATSTATRSGARHARADGRRGRSRRSPTPPPRETLIRRPVTRYSSAGTLTRAILSLYGKVARVRLLLRRALRDGWGLLRPESHRAATANERPEKRRFGTRSSSAFTSPGQSRSTSPRADVALTSRSGLSVCQSI